MRVKYSWLLMASLGLSACGGSAKPAEEPEAEAKAEESKADEKTESDSAAKSDESDSKSTDKKEEPVSSEPKVTRSPKDIVTAPDVVFMFSFSGSDMSERAEQQCDEKIKDNPKKRAECMTRAKKKIEIDGMRFKQERGRWYWSTIRLKGKVVVTLNKVPIEFGKEDEHSIVLKPVGKDEGTAPGKGLSETKLAVPNDYQIELQDPKHGKMVFEAKIGLVEN